MIHDTKKPGCYQQVFEFLQKSDAKVDRADQVVIIGDRLFTDVKMGNLMGAWSIWIKDGPVKNSSLVSFL